MDTTGQARQLEDRPAHRSHRVGARDFRGSMERLSRLRPRLLSKPVSPRPKSVRGPHFCRRELDQPFPRPPFVLLQEHGTKLRQRLGADIVERPEDAFAIFDCERHDLAFESE